MSFLEGVSSSSDVAIVAAGEVSSDRPYTFFRIKFPIGMKCTEIFYRTARFPLVARWQDGRLDWVEGAKKGKAKELGRDPSGGGLRVIGAISDDGRIYLHEGLVANGNREQVKAYCERLVRSLSGD